MDILKARVPTQTKKAVQVIAQRQDLSESAWLRRLVEQALQSAGVRGDSALEPVERVKRRERVTVQLAPDDQRLLRERGKARGMPAATYVSVLVRAHLRAVAPLPNAELGALKRVVGELSVVGRNLNQIARSANQGGAVSGPSREELRAVLKACEALRDHVRALIEANLTSWELGHDATND